MPKSPTGFRSEVLVQPERMAIYAAAKNFTIGKARPGVAPTSSSAAGEEWQNTGWDFYDTIGEYRYAVDWVGNLLSRATLYVTKDGKRTEDANVLEVVQALFGGPDGQAEMLRSLGIHYTVAGEAYVIGVDMDDQDDWFVIASTEIRRSGDNRFSVQGLDLEIAEGDSIVMRLWRAHPRKPWKSNAPTRAVLPILAEIEKLTMHVAAQLDSRLAGAGLLLLPSEMTFPQMPTTQVQTPPSTEEDEAAPTPTGAQAFVNMLIEVMSKAIGDRSDASALVPVVLQVAGEYLEKVQHLKFWSDLDEKAIELRNEAIRRLALGMDMPPEILTGTAEVNHWGAWQVDESSIKSHSEPLLKAITSALTAGYLWPVLEADGMDRDEARTYAIAADTTQLRMRPNRSRESQELWEKGELKSSTMRLENGFTEDDAPDDAERLDWLMRQVASGKSSASPEQLGQVLNMLGLKIVAIEEVAEPVRGQRAAPSLEDHPDRNPPEEVVAAAEVMVYRALERAGNRLKVRLSGKTNGTPAHELYLTMPQLTQPEVDALLEDAWASTEWATLPCNSHELEQVLNRYTHMLISLRKPHDRGLLRTNLHELFVSDRDFAAV